MVIMSFDRKKFSWLAPDRDWVSALTCRVTQGWRFARVQKGLWVGNGRGVVVDFAPALFRAGVLIGNIWTGEKVF
jgi:hypothetical protein